MEDHRGGFLEELNLAIVVAPDYNLVQVMEFAASDRLAVNEETALAAFIDKIVPAVLVDDCAVITRDTTGEQDKIVSRFSAEGEDTLL